MLEGEVDHPVRRGGRGTQYVEVVDGAVDDLRPRGGERGRGGVGAGQPDDLVSRVDEFGNDGGADPAGSAGHEDAHERPQGVDGRCCHGDVSACHQRYT